MKLTILVTAFTVLSLLFTGCANDSDDDDSIITTPNQSTVKQETKAFATAIYKGGSIYFSWQNKETATESAILNTKQEKLANAKIKTSTVYGKYSTAKVEIDESQLNGSTFKIQSKDADGSILQYEEVKPLVTNLPVVFISTDNGKDVDSKENKINATMNILDDNNALEDAKLTIKGRGNSSWGMAKKSYTIKFENKQELLGMSKHKSWALIANYCDKTLLRNSLAYECGRKIMDGMAWNPDTRNVHLYLNGEHLGLYMVCESVKIDKKRVNIKNIEDCNDATKANEYGFVLEFNNRMNEVFNFKSTKGIPFSLKEPDGEEISDELKELIKTYTNAAEEKLYSDNLSDFDIDSFIDWWIVNEVTKNNDSVLFASCYMYYDNSDSKFHMGPLWDFDISMGNVNYNDCDNPEGFWVKKASWIDQMFKNEEFKNKAKERWNSKKTELTTFFTTTAQTQFTELSADAKVNFDRWQILGTYIWPNAVGYQNRTTYEAECKYLTDWMQNRINWMDSAVSGL